MACPCLDRTVLDFMEDNEEIATDNNVITHLLNAMAALDDARAAENLSETRQGDLPRIREYRAMYSKLDATIKYIKARL